MPDATKYPPRTHGVHARMGPKVLWAESRVQGTGEYFPPLQSYGKIVEVEIDGFAPSIAPSENFAEQIRTVTCVGLKA
ncbi:hypothetical protein TNCV_4999571 [Trichonephila clavipes]|nr:hypothetical protein TNCV_4999571 [Trichonephila clavipes]